MKINRYVLPCVALMLAWSASPAHAAVGTLTCTSNTGNITANLSYFDLGFSRPITVGGAGTGVGGRVTDTPLEIHTSLVNFQEFFNAVERNQELSKCVLTTQAGGETIEFTFKIVAVTSADAIAQSPRTAEGTPAAYLDVKLVYNQVAVTTSGGTDDGGNGAPIS